MTSKESQRKLSLFLYRSIARKTRLFDKESKYKQYFVTPVELRQKLPKYHLPGFEFNNNFRRFFRENLVLNEDERAINHSLSIGFMVLKNLNLAKYAFQQTGSISSSGSSGSISNINNNNNNNNNNNSVNNNNDSNNNDNKIENYNGSNKNNSNNNSITSVNNNINNGLDLNNGTTMKRVILTKDSGFVEFLRYLDEDIEKLDGLYGASSKLYKIISTKKNRCWPLENNEPITPGTILISHPSLKDFYRKKIVLITHVDGGKYYGVVINKPISSRPAISYLELDNEELNNVDSKPNLSKNIVKLARYAQKRPLTSIQNWLFGGPESIKDHSILANLQGLSGAQIIHPYPKIAGAKKLRTGLYIGGSYKEIKEKIGKGEIDSTKIMMFVGCVVWDSDGQLQKEINEGAWFKAKCKNDMIYEGSKNPNIWAEALKSMGGDYGDLILN